MINKIKCFQFPIMVVVFIICAVIPVFAGEERSWEWAIPPLFEIGEDDFSSGVKFSEGLAAVKKNGKYGYINRDGKEVIPFIFAKAAAFSEGLAAVSGDGKTMGFIRLAPAKPKPTPAPVSTPAPAGMSSGENKTAYLTIDDGPSRNNTPAILDILREQDIKATFFVLPREKMDDIYWRIVSEGHELANHSYSHDFKKLYDKEDLKSFTEDIVEAEHFIQIKTGYKTKFYRFPGGSGGRGEEIINPRLEILASLGYRHFNWDVSTGDSDTSPAGKNVEVLVNNVILNTQNKKKLIVLMHDSADKTATVQALPAIIKNLKEMGYTFDTLAGY